MNTDPTNDLDPDTAVLASKGEEAAKANMPPRGPSVRHLIHATERDAEGKVVDPGPGRISVRERVIQAGKAFRMTDGSTYVVGKQGQLKRVDKQKGMTKKERRMRRAAVKAVRASRSGEAVSSDPAK